MITTTKSTRANSKRLRQLWQAACATALLSGGIAGAGGTPAGAAPDATWAGATADYNVGTNWNPLGVPTNQAAFGATGNNTPTITAPASINQILFLAGAQAYNITNNSTYDINGIGVLGITNSSGTVQLFTNNGILRFNNAASVDPTVLIRTAGGDGLATSGGVGAAATGTVGASGADGTSASGLNAVTSFNNTSSADSTTLEVIGGNTTGGDGGAGGAATGTVTGVTGDGGDGGTGGTGTGGSATLNFNDTAHADGANIIGDGGFAFGGAGAAGGAATGAAGTAAPGGDGLGGDGGSGGTANGGDVFQNFNGGTSADNATFTNTGSNGTGANGAVGGASTGGVGGAFGGGEAIGGTGGTGGTGSGGSVTATFSGSSHADGATFDNTGGVGIGALGSTGGAATGGAGSAVPGGDSTGGTGGEGGTGTGGTANVVFNNTARAQGATINNIASAGTGSDGGIGGAATGGAIGAPGLGGDGIAGDGGSGGTGIGGDATATFNDASHADGATINNIGSNGTGGNGGTGGAGTEGAGGALGAGGDGGAGGAGIGGNALTTFNGTSHADNATITNSGGIGISGTAGTDGASTGVNGPGGTAGAAGVGVAGIGMTTFNDSSHANFSSITNNAGGFTQFNDTSTIVGGSIVNNPGGSTTFDGSSTAGTSTVNRTEILNDGGTTDFVNTGAAVPAASAGTSIITNQDNGTTTFSDNTTAGDADIINNLNGSTTFTDTSSGGTAAIQNNSGGELFFLLEADASNAEVLNNLGGVVDISGTTVGTSIGSLNGAGNVLLGSKVLTVGNLNLDDEISGSIQDGGASGGVGGGLTKAGTAVLLLSGASTYTGSTNINGGVLQLDGSINSDVFVNSGGTLTGTGSTNLGDVTNSGIVAPGNAAQPFGTLFVDEYTNNADGIYVARVAPVGNVNNLLSATNQATSNLDLNGGLVRVELGSGLFITEYEYTILEGNELRNGTFAGIEPGSVPFYLTGELDYSDPNNVRLILRPNATALSPGDFSSNQRNISENLDAQTNTPANYDPFFAVFLNANDAAEFQRALDRASGDSHTVNPYVNQQVSLRFNERMLNRVSSEVADTQRESVSAAYRGQQYRELRAANAPGTASFQIAVDREAEEMRRSNVWAVIAGASEDGDSDGNGPGFEARAVEYQVGFDRHVGARTLLGISAGLSNGHVNVDERNARSDYDTKSIGLYLKHESNNWYGNGAISYHGHDISSERSLIVPGAARADYDARTLALQAEVGKRYGTGKYSWEPNISLKVAHTDQDGFNEDSNGAPGALNVGSASYNTRRLGVGVRFVSRDATARFRPYAFLGYEREFGDAQVELSNQFQGLNGNFNVRGTNLGKNIFTARLGANVQVSDSFSLVGEIGASRRRNQQSGHIYGGVRYGF